MPFPAINDTQLNLLRKIAENSGDMVVAFADAGSALWTQTPPIFVSGATMLTFDRWHICTGTPSDYSVTLPPADGNEGALVGLIMGPLAQMTGFVRVVTSGGDMIDGQPSRLMWANEVAMVRSTAGNWVKVSGKSVALSCTMRRNVNQSIPGNADTKIMLNQIDLDLSNSMGDVANSRINIKRPGTYITPGQTFWSALANNEPIVASKLFLNGVNLYDVNMAGLTTSFSSVPLTVKPISFAEGDYLELWGYTFGAETIYGTVNGPASFLSLIEQSLW